MALETCILFASSSCDNPAFTLTAGNLIFNCCAIFYVPPFQCSTLLQNVCYSTFCKLSIHFVKFFYILVAFLQTLSYNTINKRKR
nr:MAG TPA: hypothetical protein [Caudoviricetes sp.]